VNYNTIKLESLGDGITLLTLNRAEKLNAISVDMFREINDAVKMVDSDRNSVVVIVRGEGDNFSSGLDFYDLFGYMESRGDFDLWAHIKFMQDTFLSIYNSEKIYIAAIDGYCFGAGLDLASACDLRIATDRAKFSIAETRLGVVADLGVLQHLIRVVGEQVVRYWAYTSRVFGALEAYSAGLLLKVCEPKEKLMDVSKGVAQEIVNNPAEAVLNTKKGINFSLSNPIEESLRFTGKLNLNLDVKALMERFKKGLK